MKYNIDDLRQQLYTTAEKKDFVHLHLHSDFSLKDGIGKPTQYAKKAIELGMPACAITDHGSIGAHPSFFMFCRSNNLKPIVGVEAYMQDRRKDVKLFEKKIDEFEQEIKVLKSAIKHKKANKTLVENHINVFRLALKREVNPDDVYEMDYGEVKEFLEDKLTIIEKESESLSKEREKLKYNQHIVLLAKNEIGRKHITKIVSNAAREGFYYKPRTSFDFISQHKEGIIISSACLAGPLNTVMRDIENDDEAISKVSEIALKYKETFGDDFYIEIMVIDIDRQKRANKVLVEVAKKLEIKWIVTNDVHYLDLDGATAQEISLMLGSKDDGGDQVTMKDKRRRSLISEILQAIGDDKTPSHIRSVYNDFIDLDRFQLFRPDPNIKSKYTITIDEIADILNGKKTFKKIWEFSTKDFWFKDRHQLIDAYIDQEHYNYISPEDFVKGLDTTLEVTNKICLWDWDSKEKLPKVDLGGKSSYDYMVEMARNGWLKKATDDWDESYIKRVKYELSVIRRTEMADYFVIVADYIQWAKNNGVVVGAGRGSAAGSLVCYLLEITNIDPIKHGLLFERFLSMSRSMAIYDLSVKDIEIDENNLESISFDEDDFNNWFDQKIINFEE
jgi:DNA polymerase-3 subunit alpha